MHRTELHDVGTCSACGCEVRGAFDRGFFFGSRGLLCHECGLERGGSYNENLNAWVNEPLVDDLGKFFD